VMCEKQIPAGGLSVSERMPSTTFFMNRKNHESINIVKDELNSVTAA